MNNDGAILLVIVDEEDEEEEERRDDSFCHDPLEGCSINFLTHCPRESRGECRRVASYSTIITACWEC